MTCDHEHLPAHGLIHHDSPATLRRYNRNFRFHSLGYRTDSCYMGSSRGCYAGSVPRLHAGVRVPALAPTHALVHVRATRPADYRADPGDTPALPKAARVQETDADSVAAAPAEELGAVPDAGSATADPAALLHADANPAPERKTGL